MINSSFWLRLIQRDGSFGVLSGAYIEGMKNRISKSGLQVDLEQWW